jgi:hypothetical protein
VVQRTRKPSSSIPPLLLPLCSTYPPPLTAKRSFSLRPPLPSLSLTAQQTNSNVSIHFDISSPSPSVPASFFPTNESYYGYDDFGSWYVDYEEVSCERWAGWDNSTVRSSSLPLLILFTAFPPPVLDAVTVCGTRQESMLTITLAGDRTRLVAHKRQRLLSCKSARTFCSLSLSSSCYIDILTLPSSHSSQIDNDVCPAFSLKAAATSSFSCAGQAVVLAVVSALLLLL